MELDILHQILNELKELKQGQIRLEQSQARLEQSQARLEQSQARLEQRQAKLEQSQARLEQGQIEINQRLDNLEHDVSAIKTQQAMDTESIEIIIVEIGKINIGQKTHSQEIEKLRATS